MDKEPPIIYKTTPLTVVLKTFGDYNYHNYPVIDQEKPAHKREPREVQAVQEITQHGQETG